MLQSRTRNAIQLRGSDGSDYMLVEAIPFLYGLSSPREGWRCYNFKGAGKVQTAVSILANALNLGLSANAKQPMQERYLQN
jgi:hypothetical protein